MPPSISPDRPWTVLVAEDEPRLREGLAQMLRETAFPIGEILLAGDGEEALAHCRLGTPDLAFLDIRMPGLSGLELASRLPERVQVVFVTAYDSHAIEAFERGAVDYLLKPVTPERLQKTLERLRARAPLDRGDLRSGRAGETPSAALPEKPLQWLTATSGRRIHWIDVEDILFCISDSKYTRVECREGTFFIPMPIKELAGRLDPATFRQVHRSALVHLKAIAWVERLDNGGGQVHLRHHAEVLPVSAPFLRDLSLPLPR